MSWRHAITLQLLNRYGVVFRETAHAENISGGFSAIYDVLKAMEESGRIRRGYFAADLGATQFALPAAVEQLRLLRDRSRERTGAPCEILQLAATDPANPYGALLRWPTVIDTGSLLARSVGARVILCDGSLVAYLRRGNPNVQFFLPEEEPHRSNVARTLSIFLVEQLRVEREENDARQGLLIATINGTPAAEHWIARYLLDAGFASGAMGFNVRRGLSPIKNIASEPRFTV